MHLDSGEDAYETVSFLSSYRGITYHATSCSSKRIFGKIGGQLGFIATGAVVDIPLGPMAVQAGINYPLGIRYIEFLAGGDGSFVDDFLSAFFVVTSDITYPIALGKNFDLKLGVSGIGLTDFQSMLIGVIGPAVKGEYWIADKDYGLFVNLNIPVMALGVTDEGTMSVVDPALPLLGLFTTSAGVLWSL
jgi:hypothetical protein